MLLGTPTKSRDPNHKTTNQRLGSAPTGTRDPTCLQLGSPGEKQRDPAGENLVAGASRECDVE